MANEVTWGDLRGEAAAANVPVARIAEAVGMDRRMLSWVSNRDEICLPTAVFVRKWRAALRDARGTTRRKAAA